MVFLLETGDFQIPCSQMIFASSFFFVEGKWMDRVVMFVSSLFCQIDLEDFM